MERFVHSFVSEGILHEPSHFDAQTDHRREVILAKLRDADIGSLLDFALRYLVVTLAGWALFYATQSVVILVWWGGYLCVNTLYSFALSRARGPVSDMTYRALLLGNMVSSGIFMIMPLYLYALEENAMHALAVCGMAGHAMFNLARHRGRTPIMYWDIACMLLYVCYAAYWEAIDSTTFAERLVILVGAVAVGTYYATAQLGIIATHERLEDARRASVHDHKIQAIGRLTGGVAHDFNNLLTVVKGNLELYDELNDPVEQKEVVNEAHKAASRAAEVIAQLLAFSRQSRLAPQELHLSKWASEFETLAFRPLPETIQTSLQLGEVTGPVYVDAGQLTAAVMNLALNARDALDGRPGHLDLRVSEEYGVLDMMGSTLPKARYICFSVTDTGAGMDAATLAKVTEPFFTTKPPGRGSGLGLSMARGFAEQSGGGMRIKSVINAGTTVTVCIRPDPAN